MINDRREKRERISLVTAHGCERFQDSRANEITVGISWYRNAPSIKVNFATLLFD